MNWFYAIISGIFFANIGFWSVYLTISFIKLSFYPVDWVVYRGVIGIVCLIFFFIGLFIDIEDQ